MTRVALKGLAGRKLRAFLTAVAIVRGVAMISGTYVLTDTIKSAFSTVFTQVYKHTDAIVTGKSAIGTDQNSNGLPPSFSESLLARVRAVLALGRIAFDTYLRLLAGREGFPPRSSFHFAHGASFALPQGLPRLFASYHPSQQNTQTGKLTPEMMRQVMSEVRRYLARRSA